MKNTIIFGVLTLLIGCSMQVNANGDGLDINTLKAPLHVHDAKKVCDMLKNGHGPYLWCAMQKGDKEVWFWFIPRENMDADDFEVAFITEGKAVDPDTQGVVWPKTLKGMPLDQVYKMTYKDFIQK
jgi:hypothetical protein